MDVWTWTAILAGAIVAVWIVAVLALVAAGRRSEARALAGFLPDCAVLLRRLSADSRIPRGRRTLLLGALAYLAMPIDLVPDFVPVAGQLDDALVVAFVLRSVVRSAGPAIVEEHWPGPASSRTLILRLASAS
jgi:uncharacterized membrane protein YkvA (DUF1232 family)